MSTMEISPERHSMRGRQIVFWATVACTFLAALAIQIFLLYRTPANDFLRFLAPALAAGLFSTYRVVRFYRRSGSLAPAPAVAALVVATLVSPILGLSLSINLFGA